MDKISLESPLKGREILNILIIVVFVINIIFSGLAVKNINEISNQFSDLSLIQGNSILAASNPFLPPQSAKKVKMIITAYSSTPWQTDSTPFVTAAGTEVREGIVANNLLPIGTEIRIPELYGDKVFVVEDRMNSRKSKYHVDIWFPDYYQAKSFGAKTSYVEILEG